MRAARLVVLVALLTSANAGWPEAARADEEPALAEAAEAEPPIAEPAEPEPAPSEPTDAEAEPPIADPPDRGATLGRVPPHFPFNVGLVHPIAINYATPELWTHFDLALVLSRVGFVDGVQLGTVGWVGYDLRGVQVALVSAVGGRTTGLQLGAGFAWSEGRVAGAQVAGLINWAPRVHGLQLGGVGNQITGRLDGVQLGGVFNVLRGKDLEGIQAALQVAPINISQKSEGLQIGVFNVAKRIEGLQIGVVNVTNDLRGESLGIIPLPREGGIHLALWGSNTLFFNGGVKFASRYAYSILSAGVGREDQDDGAPETVVAPGLTMGAQFKTGLDGLRLAADLGAYRRFRDELALDEHDELYKVRGIVAYALAERMAPFLGAGVYLSLRDDPVDHATEGSVGPEVFLGLEL
jgi:hypothetical protein